jgi:hypothetical protein
VEELRKWVLESAIHDYDDKPFLYPKERKAALQETLEDFIQWLNKVSRLSCVYWLWHSSDSDGASEDDALRLIADHCQKQHAPAAGFFFPKFTDTRDLQDKFVPTLAWELMRNIPHLHAPYRRICREKGAYEFGKRISTQMAGFIIKPFKQLPPKQQRQPLLFMINGLDRCQSWHAHNLLEAIADCVEQLPACFIISCRREKSMTQMFERWKLRDVTHQADHKVKLDVGEGI